MSKNYHKIFQAEEVYQAVLEAVDAFDIVKATLGARGRNIALPRPGGYFHVTKDGASIVREIFLENTHADHWAQTLKEVSIKTEKDAGDGTTTATALALAIIREGIKNVTAGANPMDVKKGIDAAVLDVVELLKTYKIDVAEDSKQIQQVATISTNGDAVLGKIISDAFAKVTAEGHIDIKDSKDGKTYLEIVEGMEVDSGYTSPYFMNNFGKQTAEYSSPLIFVSEKKLVRADQIQAILGAIPEKERTRPILFITDEVKDAAEAMLILNAQPLRKDDQRKHSLPWVAVNAPNFGNNKREFLEDICVSTGATLISDTKGVTYDNLTYEMFGNCEKIIVSSSKATIVIGKGDKDLIKARCEALRKSIKDEKIEMKERVYKKRLSALNGAIAIIHVGANSTAEIKEIKDRIDDAIKACRSASLEGVIAGGGVALVRASHELKAKNLSVNDDIKTGYKIVVKAIEAPLRQIVENADGSADVVINELLKRVHTTGYDVRESRYVDMMKTGIIDPVKVTRVALENAASIAGLILTTVGTIIPTESND